MCRINARRECGFHGGGAEEIASVKDAIFSLYFFDVRNVGGIAYRHRVLPESARRNVARGELRKDVLQLVRELFFVGFCLRSVFVFGKFDVEREGVVCLLSCKEFAIDNRKNVWMCAGFGMKKQRAPCIFFLHERFSFAGNGERCKARVADAIIQRMRDDDEVCTQVFVFCLYAALFYCPYMCMSFDDASVFDDCFFDRGMKCAHAFRVIGSTFDITKEYVVSPHGQQKRDFKIVYRRVTISLANAIEVGFEGFVGGGGEDFIEKCTCGFCAKACEVGVCDVDVFDECGKDARGKFSFGCERNGHFFFRDECFLVDEVIKDVVFWNRLHGFFAAKFAGNAVECFVPGVNDKTADVDGGATGSYRGCASANTVLGL